MLRYHRANKRMERLSVSLPARRSIGIGSCGGVVSPVAARLNRSVTPSASRSGRATGIAPVTASSLSRRLGATLLAMTVVVAVAALHARPVTRLVALARSMTLLVAVTALHDTRLAAIARNVILVATVVAGATRAASHGLTRLSALRLAMSEDC